MMKLWNWCTQHRGRLLTITFLLGLITGGVLAASSRITLPPSVSSGTPIYADDWNTMRSGLSSLDSRTYNIYRGTSKTSYTGIGTSSPTAKLHVAGNIIASDPSKDEHVATKNYVDDKVSAAKISISGQLCTGGKLGAYKFCALSYVTNADDENSCKVYKSGSDWYLKEYSGASCCAYCFK